MPIRSVEVPAEVDLRLDDLLAVEAQHLGVAKPAAVGSGGLVGDHDLVSGLDQPDELEAVAAAGAEPALLEVAIPIEPRVRWTEEEEVGCEQTLDDLPFARGERAVDGAGDVDSIWTAGHSVSLRD